MSIFAFKHYKPFLANYIKTNKYKGLISQLAQACGCDRTYISQVLNGKADLLPDHVVKLCDFLNLTEIESEYFLNLLLQDRATTPAARHFFENKINKIKNSSDELSKKIENKNDASEISEVHKNLYYSNWLFPLIHTLTSINQYQTVDSISKKISCTENVVVTVLKTLVKLNLVTSVNGKFVHSGLSLYLKREASQIYSFHLQARLESVRRSYEKQDIHFTNVFSVSTNDVGKLRDQIVNLIENHRKTVHESGAETVGVFNCDFFTL